MRYIILLGYLYVTFLQADSIYITDKDDNQIRVDNPSIYYTSKKGSSLSLFYRPDVEKNGIRVQQGMGMIVIPWTKIATLHINDMHDNNISAILENNNTSIPLSLIKPYDGLEGESTLGTFLIHFKDIKRISTSKQISRVSKDIHIQWGEGLNLDLKKEGFRTTTKGLRVFASFRLKDEQFRSVKLTDSIRYPLHNMLLVRHKYTVYILDLKKEEMIGQFKIPSRGTPRFVKIEPHENGYTSLKVMFRMLPRARTEEEKKQKIIRPIGRPGPLITKIMVYRDGKYIHQKRKND